jgi:hypothetical protein
MSSEQHRDFVSQLRRSVHEEAPLWEVPLASRELGTTTVERGPWNPLACSHVLVGWLDQRWLGLYRLKPGRDAEDLEHEEARRILSEPERWSVGHIGTVCLFETERGKVVSEEEGTRVVAK